MNQRSDSGKKNVSRLVMKPLNDSQHLLLSHSDDHVNLTLRHKPKHRRDFRLDHTSTSHSDVTHRRRVSRNGQLA